jgi:hypothetical protein
LSIAAFSACLGYASAGAQKHPNFRQEVMAEI